MQAKIVHFWEFLNRNTCVCWKEPIYKKYMVHVILNGDSMITKQMMDYSNNAISRSA